MRNITIYSSTKDFGNYLIDNTNIKNYSHELRSLVESDANRPNEFFKLPDKIKQLMFLDAADAIIAVDNEPILVVEESHEAGTGHNAFQRFPRLAASIEKGVPCLYIYPEAAVIDRQDAEIKWDPINPLIFKAALALKDIFHFPALLFYYPSLYGKVSTNLDVLPNKGLIIDDDYLGCPKADSSEMQSLFSIVNDLIGLIEQQNNIKTAKSTFRNLPSVRNRIEFMYKELTKKTVGRDCMLMSPLSACTEIDTKLLLDYLSKYEDSDYQLGVTLRSKEKTILYKVDAKFRGDPYPGCLAAIDYLSCRYGDTTEERSKNLVILWGDFEIANNKLIIKDNGKSTIKDFINCVHSSENKSLLSKEFDDLENYEIPRYFMQLKYGTAFTKVKHLRVYSYFADAIIFPDGCLWKD